MAKAQRGKRRYITGFDGLRTLGVIGVILYHLRPDLFQGGYLGVPIFMVVSGYLITDGLLMQFQDTQRIDFKTFFIKRIKRLYPGLIAVLFATSAYIVLFARDLLQHLHMIVLTNLLYVYNWWQIGHGQSYFARYANGESPFTHLWTLSIEGQYYLVWPFIVLGLLVLVKNRSKIFNVVFVLAVVSAVWMFILYRLHPNADPSRLYYGTDTRAFSILLGAALAFIWPSRNLAKQVEPAERVVLNLAGSVALVGMLALVFTLSDTGGLLYEGGMFLFSLLTMVLVAVVAHPAAFFNTLLSNPVFHWIGTRSYGIYLYQFPVMIFWEKHFTNVADHPVLYPVIEIGLILVLTELSFRFIEQPLAKFDYHQTLPTLRRLLTSHQRLLRSRLVAGASVVILLLGTLGIAEAPHAAAPTAEKQLTKQLQKNQTDKKQQERQLAAARSSISAAKASSEKVARNSSLSRSASLSQSKAAEDSAQKHPVNAEYEKYGLTQVELQEAQRVGFTGIGDSVMLDGKPLLQQLFPHAYIDAAVSRQMVDTIGKVAAMSRNGELAGIVVIGLGTNGPFSNDQLAQMMQAVGNRTVFWINVRVPTRSWQNTVNSMLASAAKHYANLHVIDWYGYSNSHENWFYKDRVHPNTVGNPYYAAYITKSIVDTLNH